MIAGGEITPQPEPLADKIEAVKFGGALKGSSIDGFVVRFIPRNKTSNFVVGETDTLKVLLKEAVKELGIPTIEAESAIRPVYKEVTAKLQLLQSTERTLVGKDYGFSKTLYIPLASDISENTALNYLASLQTFEDPSGMYDLKVSPSLKRKLLWTPNDTDIGWRIPKTRLPEAWDHSRGAGVKVAIVDSGVKWAPEHPDLAGKVENYPLSRSFIGTISDFRDVNGHGTAVAGVIGALTNNSLGIAGVCPECRLMIMKVTDTDFVSDEAAVAAIQYAISNGAQVINLSFGSTEYTDLYEDVLNYARDQGVVVVAAAGNDDQSEGSNARFYPAALDGVLSVTATDYEDFVMFTANFGNWVDIAAPGHGTVTTALSGGYERRDGSSMAAAFVSGLVGLMKANVMSSSAQSIRTRLKRTAVPIDIHNFSSLAGKLGAGRVDCAEAVKDFAHAPNSFLVSSATVQDPPPGGNGNGIPEQGERIRIFPKIRNVGGLRADSITAVLDTPSSPVWSSIRNSITYSAIEPSDEERPGSILPTNPLMPFELAISQEAPLYQSFVLTGSIYESGSLRNTFSILLKMNMREEPFNTFRSNQETPSVEGGRVMWVDDRDLSAHPENTDILYALINDPQERRIDPSQESSGQIEPASGLGWVVWKDFRRDPYGDVFLLDPFTNQPMNINLSTNIYMEQKCPTVYGGNIAWLDYREGWNYARIHYYNYYVKNDERIAPVSPDPTVPDYNVQSYCPVLRGDTLVWSEMAGPWSLLRRCRLNGTSACAGSEILFQNWCNCEGASLRPSVDEGGGSVAWDYQGKLMYLPFGKARCASDLADCQLIPNRAYEGRRTASLLRKRVAYQRFTYSPLELKEDVCFYDMFWSRDVCITDSRPALESEYADHYKFLTGAKQPVFGTLGDSKDYIVWADARNDNWDLYMAKLSPHPKLTINYPGQNQNINLTGYPVTPYGLAVCPGGEIPRFLSVVLFDKIRSEYVAIPEATYNLSTQMWSLSIPSKLLTPKTEYRLEASMRCFSPLVVTSVDFKTSAFVEY